MNENPKKVHNISLLRTKRKMLSSYPSPIVLLAQFFFLLRYGFEIGWFEGGGWHLVARRGWLTEMWNFYFSRGSFTYFFCCKHFCFWIDFTALWSVLCFVFIPQLMASSKTCVPNGDILKPKVSCFLSVNCHLLISY